MARRISTTLLYLLIILPSLFAIPVKQVGNIEKRGATDADCYGTNCYFDEGYYENGEDQEVMLPENLTEAIMSVLPAVEGSQTKIVALLNESLALSRHENSQLNSVLSNIESLQSETVGLMKRNEMLMENMTELIVSAVSLLRNQLDVQTVGLPYQNFHSCQDFAARGMTKSGPYAISVNNIVTPVYCDMETDSGGWTVFQRRFDGTVDFFRGWEDYENGFGSPDGEYWLGLHNSWRLTRNQRMVLRIDMEAFDGDTAYAVYDSFAVGDAASNYQLTIGSYSGTAGDSLRIHNNREFSTKDRDHDADGGRHCAQRHTGAWWYSRCYQANLNGLYVNAPGYSPFQRGMTWLYWKGDFKSVKSTEMKMRRA